MTDEPPAETGSDAPGAEAGEVADPADAVAHDPSGLDLARALARSARGRPLTAGSRRAPSGGGRFGSRRRSAPTDRAGSGAHPDDRDPQTADATLARLVAEQGWATSLRAHGVFARWPDLVGEEIASHSRPESFADGKLVVGTDSTAWATQLRLLAPTLLRRLNTELGHGTVVVIDVRGPNVGSWTRGRRSVKGGRGPRDTYG